VEAEPAQIFERAEVSRNRSDGLRLALANHSYAGQARKELATVLALLIPEC